MRRSTCRFVAVVGLALSPGHASAFGPWFCQPRPHCYPPPYAPPFAYAVPYWPVYQPPLPPPQVYLTPAMPLGAVPKPVASEAPMSPVQGAIRVEPTPRATPAIVPPTSEAVALPTPVPPRFDTPQADPTLPAANRVDPRPLAVPGIEAANAPAVARSAVPPLVLPSKGATPPPAFDPFAPPPPAVPTPAPAPSEPSPFIPPSAPRVPLPPQANKTDGDMSLPPLVLPPVTPTPEGKVTAQSSPLAASARPSVTVIPVAEAGETVPGRRKVGFFNHSDRDLALVVHGTPVSLPRKHYLRAELPATFVWKLGAGEAETVVLPEGQPGVEFLFR